MGDRQSAAILIAIAVVAFVLWYRLRSEEERTHLFGYGSGTPGLSQPSTGPKPVAQVIIDNIQGFARLNGLGGESQLQKQYGSGPPGFDLPKGPPGVENQRRRYGLYGQ